MKRLRFGAGAALLLLIVAASARADTMNDEIDFLLTSVGSSDCTFIRNGKSHDAVAAQKHLQMKRERGKRHFSNTDEFIERLASKSSWTGKLYFIQCGNEEQQPAGEWFAELLTKYREPADQLSN